MKLPNTEFRKLVKMSRDPKFKKEIYQAQKQRKIDWPAYNDSHIYLIKDSLDFIREITNDIYCPKVRGNATNPKKLAKAILVSELMQSPERSAQGWVEILGPYIRIYDKLDDWVIGNGYSRPEVASVLYEIFLAIRDSDGILMGWNWT